MIAAAHETNDGAADVARARTARFIMALRSRGIRDPRILNAFERVPREPFLPAALEAFAYEDWLLPLPVGQTATSPFTLASLFDALQITTAMKVLEVGTGTGFGTAILASLCRRVATVERVEELHRIAAGRLAERRLGNVDASFGDGAARRIGAGFDRIIVHAKLDEAPKVLLDQLAHNGSLAFVRGEGWAVTERGKDNETRPLAVRGHASPLGEGTLTIA